MDPALIALAFGVVMLAGGLYWLIAGVRHQRRPDTFFWDDVFVRRGNRPAMPRFPDETADSPQTPSAPAAWHQILDVPAQAGAKEVRRAYHAKMKVYHPDRVVGLPATQQAQAEIRARELNEAFRTGMNEIRQRTKPARFGWSRARR